MPRRKTENPSARITSDSGRIFYRMEDGFYLSKSQLTLFVEKIHARSTLDQAFRVSSATLSISAAFCAFFLSPILTCTPDNFRSLLGVPGHVVHTLFVAGSTLSGLIMIIAGICCFCNWKNCRDSCGRENVISYAINYAEKNYSDQIKQ